MDPIRNPYVPGAGTPPPELTGWAELLDLRDPLVAALSPDDAAAALSEPAKSQGVQYEGAALDKIVEVTRGYPYFLQEWGYHAWKKANFNPIRAAK